MTEETLVVCPKKDCPYTGCQHHDPHQEVWRHQVGCTNSSRSQARDCMTCVKVTMICEVREIEFMAWDAKEKVMHEHVERADVGSCGYRSFEAVLSSDFVVLQYIGLKDRSGKKLYHKHCVRDDFKNVWLIDWSNEYAGYELNLLRSEMGSFPKLNICRVPEMEYIGNAFENPELLPKGD